MSAPFHEAGAVGDSYQRIPRSCAQADSVVGDAQAAHTVLVANERANLLTTRHIPDLRNRQHATARGGCPRFAYLALEVIVAGEEETARNRRGNRGNTAKNRFRLQTIVSMP